VRRSNYEKLVTSDLIVQTMNAIARSEAHVKMVGTVPELPEVIARQQSTGEEEEGPKEQTQEEEPQRDPDRGEVQEQAAEGDIQETSTESEADSEEEEKEPTTTTRSGQRIIKPSHYLAVTKVSQADWKLQATDKAIKVELCMLFEDLLALHVVCRAAIKGGTKILCSHMFVVEKFLANGEFDKMRARLVADGRDQDAEMYPNKASPTVVIQSVFTILGLASMKPWRIVVKIDIKGAFIQTPMTGEPIYMKIDPKMTKYVVELYPHLKEMVEADGCLYTEMLKAMYGCVQASALWYALIRR
jgi:hypothetical protein